MKTNLFLGGIVMIGLTLSACSTTGAPSTQPASGPAVTGGQVTKPTTIEVTHSKGKSVVPLNPKKVITFDYSALDTLEQLGVEVIGLPQGNLPPFLEKYKASKYANVGTLFEPDYEKINELKPDLIISGGRSAAVYDELNKLAPTIDITNDQKNYLASFKNNTLAIAQVFEKQDVAKQKLDAIDAAIARTKAKASGKALIVMITGGKVTAYGPGSRFGMIHDILGIQAVAPNVEVETHGEAISFEFIQEKNPDRLYVIDRDSSIGQAGASAKSVLDNPLVHTTSAWKNNKVTYLDSYTWYLANYGLGTVASMVTEVENSLK